MRLIAKAALGALAMASLGLGIDAGTPAHASVWMGPRGGVAVTPVFYGRSYFGRGFYGRGYYGRGYYGRGYYGRGYYGGYRGYYRPYGYGGYYRPYAYGYGGYYSPMYHHMYRHPLRYGYYRRWG